jgi:hypothetical protein
VFSVLALMATGLVVVAGPAAAVTCSGYGCDHQNPYGSGCSNSGQVIYDVPLGYSDGVGGTAYDGHVRLHYSTTCRTVWASVYGLAHAVGSSDDKSASAHVHRNSDGTTLTCNVASGSTSCYTNMLYDGGVTSYATGSNYAYDPFDGYWVTYYGRTSNY